MGDQESILPSPWGQPSEVPLPECTPLLFPAPDASPAPKWSEFPSLDQPCPAATAGCLRASLGQLGGEQERTSLGPAEPPKAGVRGRTPSCSSTAGLADHGCEALNAGRLVPAGFSAWLVLSVPQPHRSRPPPWHRDAASPRKAKAAEATQHSPGLRQGCSRYLSSLPLSSDSEGGL